MLLNVRLVRRKALRTLFLATWLHVHCRSAEDSAPHGHSGVQTKKGFTQHVLPLWGNQ